MNNRISPEKFLSIWEGMWGQLTPDWKKKFESDPRLKKVLSYPENSIQLAVFRFKKLDDILNYLDEVQVSIDDTNKALLNNSKKSDRNINVDYVASGMNQKESEEFLTIIEWLTKLSKAKLNPENTFPRLIIKSDGETCRNKVRYKNEKDAILSIIDLGKIKREDIWQLPYKCNICKEYHNTHLISRETLEKLLRKYKSSRKN